MSATPAPTPIAVSAPAPQGPRRTDKGPIVKKPATFVQVKQLGPTMTQLNLKVKVHVVRVIMDKTRIDGSRIRVAEAIVGDSTGCVIATLRNEQIDAAQPGNLIEVRNGKIEMFKGYMRLVVDKWGKVNKSAETPSFTVALENNLSSVEYELVEDNATAEAQ
eukprot:TRINITY_DN10731_c0_g1_i1.p1 TRINITY_DN10731_c0_g1~~TRINITY_DN10731_c0_g1_i1.p1  ORF type:complete len:175 (-),score=59.64 TRINITY_DN10731_c0_g1_i1:252-737(-)